MGRRRADVDSRPNMPPAAGSAAQLQARWTAEALMASGFAVLVADELRARPPVVRMGYESVDEAAAAWGIDRAKLYAAIKDGTLRTFKDGVRRYVTVDAMREFVALRERQTAGADAREAPGQARLA